MRGRRRNERVVRRAHRPSNVSAGQGASGAARRPMSRYTSGRCGAYASTSVRQAHRLCRTCQRVSKSALGLTRVRCPSTISYAIGLTLSRAQARRETVRQVECSGSRRKVTATAAENQQRRFKIRRSAAEQRQRPKNTTGIVMHSFGLGSLGSVSRVRFNSYDFSRFGRLSVQ